MKITNLEIKNFGNITGKLPNRMEIIIISDNLLYVPDFDGQLISVRKIKSAICTVIFKNENVFIE